MAIDDARPYLMPAADTITWEPWHIRNGDDWITLPDYIEGWDPGTDLKLRRIFRVNAARLQSETLLDPNCFGVNVSWRSSTTGMVESASLATMPDRGEGEISTHLLGARLGGTLRIRSTVVLVNPPDSSPPGSVQIPGSVVAEDEQDLILERGAPMFPVNILDFARTRYSPNASWHLETGGDLDAPFLGAFMLLINSRDSELCAAIERGTKDKVRQALYDEMEAGVASLMIELAIQERDHLLEETWPAETVGDVLKRTLERSGLLDAVPPSAYDLADFRSRLAGAVRSMGQGRAFK